MTQPSLTQGIITSDIGQRLLRKAQRLWCVNRRCRWSLTVDQAMQDVEDVGLGGDACFQSQFDSAKHCLLVMLQHQCQYLRHLLVSTRTAQELALQLLEGLWELQERRAITQCPRLALDYCQIVPPVIDCPPSGVVRSVDNPSMFAQDLTLGGHDDPLGIDPDANRAVGKGCWDAIPIAFKADQADR